MYNKFIGTAKRRPLTTFFGLLLLLFALIVISNLINKPKISQNQEEITVRNVQVYTIGTSPKITVQAQVEKSGVIKVVSLGAGVIQAINVSVGQEISQGTNLISMSTNYQGGNAFAVQRQLAQAQYKNALDTYPVQKDLIRQQIELAQKTTENADKLRDISNQSVSETQDLINLNNDILDTLSSQQTDLESSNVNGANDKEILQVKELKAQLEAGNNQLKTALRNTQYSTSSDNPPAEISNISKTITLEQLYVQQKALDLNKEVSRLSLVLAEINEGLLHPVSPVGGVVERIFVREGQAVNPGMPLVQVSGQSNSLMAVALLSKEMADGISKAQVSTLHIGKDSLDEVPFYVSQEATDGTLYTAQFQIPQEYSSGVTDKGFISIDIPLDFPKTGGAVPFIPLDSVFQSQDQSSVFVAVNGRAETRIIKLGQVMGGFVEVEEGLKPSDQVILDRNIIAKDPVKIVR